MAAKRIDSVGETARQIRQHPIVVRLLDDAELRESIQDAYASSRKAYSRLGSSKAPAKALLDDKKLQKELRSAADSLKDASERLRKPVKRRRRRLGKLIVVTFVGTVAAVALSEGLRSKVLDLLFGAEEEFDYSSTTAPATPPPATETPAAAEPVATAATVERAVPDSAAESTTDEVEADSEATTTSS